jgi:hypothetical protein
LLRSIFDNSAGSKRLSHGSPREAARAATSITSARRSFG